MQPLLRCSNLIPHYTAHLNTYSLKHVLKRNPNPHIITRVFSAHLTFQSDHLNSLKLLNRLQVRTYSSKLESKIPQLPVDEAQALSTCIEPATSQAPLYQIEGKLVLKGKLTIPKDINIEGMQKLIKELIRLKDKDAIKDLIQLLREENIFPNTMKIGTIGGFNITNWNWEAKIQDGLIEARDFNLIKNIFPLFSLQALQGAHVFYEPIRKGDLGLVQALVEGGMQPFRFDDRHSLGDVFLYSIFLKQLEITRYLLKATIYDINGPYNFCVECAEGEVEFGLYASRDCITPAYLAVLMNDPKLLEALIKLGADCNQPNRRPAIADTYPRDLSDHYVDNPLLCSIKKKHYGCFNVLLEMKSINLNYRGSNGKTPLLIAMQKGQFLMGQAFIAKGADVNLYDEFNFTAIMLAVLASDIPTIRALLNAGADTRCIDGLKRNLWHYFACSSYPEETCQLLKVCDIKDLINDENKFGETPFSEAIESCNPSAVRALLKCGANIKNKIENSHRLALAEATLKKMEFLLAEYPQEESYSRKIKGIKEIISIL